MFGKRQYKIVVGQSISLKEVGLNISPRNAYLVGRGNRKALHKIYYEMARSGG